MIPFPSFFSPKNEKPSAYSYQTPISAMSSTIVSHLTIWVTKLSAFLNEVFEEKTPEKCMISRLGDSEEYYTFYIEKDTKIDIKFPTLLLIFHQVKGGKFYSSYFNLCLLNGRVISVRHSGSKKIKHWFPDPLNDAGKLTMSEKNLYQDYGVHIWNDFVDPVCRFIVENYAGKF